MNRQPGGRRFLAVYTLANAGAGIAYAPLLTPLLPVRIAAVTAMALTVGLAPRYDYGALLAVLAIGTMLAGARVALVRCDRQAA